MSSISSPSTTFIVRFDTSTPGVSSSVTVTLTSASMESYPPPLALCEIVVVRSGLLTMLSSTPVTVTVLPADVREPPRVNSSGVNVSSAGCTVAVSVSLEEIATVTLPVGRLAGAIL